MALISKSKIEEATARLVKAYQPEAIYLFGSYAWGVPNEDSDLDFMVVLAGDTEISWDLQRKSSYSMWGLEFATDVLLKNRSRFEKRAAHPSTLEHKIKKEGLLVHGRI
jgi:uncharacterized protein